MAELYEKEHYTNIYPKYKKIMPHIHKFGFNGVLFYAKLSLNKNKLIKFKSKQLKHPIFLRNNTSDIPTLYQIYYELEYDLDFKKDPEVIIDCGANIGLSSVFFKNKFPKSRIIAIEPERSNYNLLLKNIEKYSDIIPLKKGIWSKKANLVIEDISLGNWGFIVKEINQRNINTVQGISITEIIKKYKLDCIDLLKIDIEGSEKELFDRNFEKWLPYVNCLIVELHDRFKPGCSESFYKAIENYEFNITHSGENIILTRK